MKHMIWNSWVDPDDYKEFINEEYPDATDDQKWEIASDAVYQWLDDEKTNLSIELPGRILVVADLGLWNGRRSGYKVLGHEEGTKLNAIFNAPCGDDQEFYSDGYNVRCTDYHHDGRNYYTFRLVKEGKKLDILLNKIYYGKATRKDINYYTKSLAPYINEVYGWGKRKAK